MLRRDDASNCAARFCVKENCPRRAERCLHQARLVALQVHLLATGVCVIHLSPDRLRAFVLSHAKFYEVSSTRSWIVKIDWLFIFRPVKDSYVDVAL